MLRVENVAHTFAGVGGNNAVEALAPVSFQVGAGEFLCIVGPSGCGKSTLLRIMAGLLAPTQGAVTLDGEAIHAPHPRIGLVFQKSNLMPWRTVLDNLALPLELAGVPAPERARQAGAMLERIGLPGFGGVFPAELSGGMAQRVALGRALVQDPEVLLLDEPFGSLDALTREQMQLDLMDLWSARRKTAIMVTHSITEAVFIADRVLVLSQRPGRIRAELEVPLSRPRRLEMVHAPDFGLLVRQVRQHIEAALSI